jgi:hypothetical protein
MLALLPWPQGSPHDVLTVPLVDTCMQPAGSASQFQQGAWWWGPTTCALAFPPVPLHSQQMTVPLPLQSGQTEKAGMAGPRPALNSRLRSRNSSCSAQNWLSAPPWLPSAAALHRHAGLLTGRTAGRAKLLAAAAGTRAVAEGTLSMSRTKIAGEPQMYGGDGEVLEAAAVKPPASAQHFNGAIPALSLH